MKEPELRAELLQRFATDQEIRKAIDDWSKKRGTMDATKGRVSYGPDSVAEGKKQIYGTQFEEVDGKFRPRPL